MKRYLLSIGGVGLLGLALVSGAAAASPTPVPTASPAVTRGTVPTVLGLTQAQVMTLRHDGLSLAQIADRQKVAVQKVVDALVAQWTERIEARVQVGALTSTEAATLRTQVQQRATTMVNQTAPGGMQGAAVGAGPRNGAGRGAAAGAGTGTGACDGTGPHGPGRP